MVLPQEDVLMIPPHSLTLEVARIGWSVKQLHPSQIPTNSDNVISCEPFLCFPSSFSVGCSRLQVRDLCFITCNAYDNL